MIGIPTDILSRLRQSHTICLFGIGALLDECYRQVVLILGREPDCLCDNAPEKWGRVYFGKPCISPEELGKSAQGMAILITVRNHESIYEQLSAMGFGSIYACHYGRSYTVVQSVFSPEIQAGNSVEASIQVKGKRTLVTGASRGIGRQITLEMARLGSNIVAHSRSVTHVTKLREECHRHGVEFVAIEADLGKPDELDRMFAELGQQGMQIDIVFNNAGISPPSPGGFWLSSSREYLDSYVINAVAPIRICQCLIPPMIKRGFGRVINVSSSITKRPGEMAYACSKAALDKFVHDLAPSLRGTGVMISLLDPGWLRTDMGGEIAPHPVESVIPGAVLGAVLDCDVNGRWISAQDYAGLSLEAALKKAAFHDHEED